MKFLPGRELLGENGLPGKGRIFFVLYNDMKISSLRLALFVTRNNTCKRWNQNSKVTAIIHFSRMVFLFPNNNVFTL